MKDRINQDLTNALKAGDTLRRDVLRMLKARILEAEVALRTKKGRDYQLSDKEVQPVIGQYAKQRRQSIEAYREAGRQELAEKEEAELKILQDYLPRALSRGEIGAVVDQIIEETGAAGVADLGKVMKQVMGLLKGGADGKIVNQIVRTKLTSG